MDSAAIPHDGSTEARAVVGALATAGQCVPCLAVSARLPELAVRAVLNTLKAHVVDMVAPCVTCGTRRLVYRVGPGTTPRQTGAQTWPWTKS